MPPQTGGNLNGENDLQNPWRIENYLSGGGGGYGFSMKWIDERIGVTWAAFNNADRLGLPTISVSRGDSTKRNTYPIEE